MVILRGMMMATTKSLNYDFFIEYIDRDGFIVFNNTSISTLYRWVNQLNYYFETYNYNYRLKVDAKNHRIYNIYRI